MTMSNSKGSSNIRNFMNPGKHAALLPPKSPFPSASPAYVDYIPPSSTGSKAVQKPRDVHHQRTSSESLVMDEQPSWLDDLLNEPETPVRRGGHRRSSSDSFAYVDLANLSKLDYLAQDEYKSKNVLSAPSWGSQDLDHFKDGWRAPFYAEANTAKQKNRMLESPSSAMSYVSNFPSSKEDMSNQISGSSSIPQDAGKTLATAMQKQDQGESSINAPKAPDGRENSHAKPSASETDAKRANSKQQFAQRSRVRKLQYIAELERNVQALQAEGTEVTAQLEFLNQQHLILSMENKALKQRLESLAQEQMIKYFEHEVLEREIGRLRTLYQQHQQQQQQQQQQQHQQQKQGSSSSGHRRSSSKDLDSQLANLSLKHKDANDNVNGPIRS